MIQKRIDLLKPYFKGIKIAEDYRIVEFNFKKDWNTPTIDGIVVEQKPLKDGGNILYNMFYSNTMTLDQILDYVEENIIKSNLEIEQKEELLRMKVEELKRVFEDKNLSELNNLKFTTENSSLKLGKSKNNKMKKTEENGTPEKLPTNTQSN